MAYVPPPTMEIAAAEASVFAWLPAPAAAEVKMISRNINLNGTTAEQKAFQLTFSEIRAIALRATGKSADVQAKAKQDVNAAITRDILNNPEYAPFKTGTAKGNDPLTE